MATGLIDQEACEEVEGRVLSACEDLRKWERLVWRKEESGAPAVVLREIRRLAAESKVKYSRLCELFAENQLNSSSVPRGRSGSSDVRVASVACA